MKKINRKWHNFVLSVRQRYTKKGTYKLERNKLYIIMGEKSFNIGNDCDLCFCDVNRHIAKTKQEILKRLDCQGGRRGRIVEMDMRSLKTKILFNGIIGYKR